MRAAKTSCKIKNKNNSKLKTQNLEHISGAEGIYDEKDVHKICNKYIQRALTHPRGEPDEIVITIEKIKQNPDIASILPITTSQCSSPDEARETISQRLSELNISKKAVVNAFKVLTSKKTMRGASLIVMRSGKRVEPDKERGIRVSRMGITKTAERKLLQILYKIVIPAKVYDPTHRAGIQSRETGFRIPRLLTSRAGKPGITGTHDEMIKNKITTIKEAVILASKVASCQSVIAEVCISDDPDYTTGYIASKRFGYLRIPNIKKYGEMHGGRVMFIKENTEIEDLIGYLEKRPILINIQGK